MTKGGSGHSPMDDDGWRRILIPSSFESSSRELRKALTELIKKHCKDNLNKRKSLETFLAWSLQVCAGKNAGAEAAIHAMLDIYNDAEPKQLF